MSMLDSHIPYETPEGIELKLAVAGPLVRSVAWLIDLGIRGVVYTTFAVLMAFLGEVGQGLMLIGLFLFEWLYPTVFEATMGATPGKRVMKLSVVMEDGTALTWQASVVRNLLRSIDFLPMMYVTGLVASMCNRKFQRLGDMVASSIVIYDDSAAVSTHSSISSNGKALSIPLSVTEQRLVLQFDERKSEMTESRQCELANILSPVTNEKDQPAIDMLSGYAAWLKGVNK